MKGCAWRRSIADGAGRRRWCERYRQRISEIGLRRRGRHRERCRNVARRCRVIGTRSYDIARAGNGKHESMSVT